MNSTICAEDIDLGRVTERDQVQTYVENRLQGRVRDLRLLLLGEGLVLQGHARTYYLKQLAQHAVLEATELPLLANDIEVS